MSAARVRYAGLATRALALAVDVAIVQVIVFSGAAILGLVGSLVGEFKIDTTLTRVLAASAWALTVAAYFASKELTASDPELIDRFATAMAKSLRYASEHPEAVRAALPRYTDLSALQARAINLPSWQPELTEDTIRTLARLSRKYGLIEREPDLDELIR